MAQSLFCFVGKDSNLKGDKSAPVDFNIHNFAIVYNKYGISWTSFTSFVH